MLTIESLIAVIGLCGTFWCIGYAMGKDSKNRHQKRPPNARLRSFLIHN